MKKETIINKSDLFEYLDTYSFVDENEIELAICEYIENQEGVLYCSDCLLASELTKEYLKENKNLI